MLPSDGNPEKATFPSPSSRSASKKRRSLPDYPKKTWFDEIRIPESGASTLQTCVMQIFPDASPKKLERWIQRVIGETSAEPELLLLAVLICGAQFRIKHPEVQAALGDLWSWLTLYPRDMNPELAELVIEAIGPGMVRAIEARGWLRGWPEGTYVGRKGAPPKNRGAWVAGFLVDDFLSQLKSRSSKVPLSADLVSILLGRKAEPNEFYRYRKKVKHDDILRLSQEVACEYEHWLIQDGVRARDFYSLPQGPEKYQAWRARHRPLFEILRDFPGEQLSFVVLSRIPAALWEPLWEFDPTPKPLAVTRK
jgi:hypothetical protein